MRRTMLIGLAAALISCQATPGASPSASESSPCAEDSICDDGPLATGRYSSTSPGADITFEVPDGGWIGATDIEGVGFGLASGDFGDFAGTSVWSFSGEVFAEACNSADEFETIETTPAAFMAWLVERDGITGDAPTETTVGGRPALTVDVTAALPAACTDPSWIWLWSVPVVGDFHLEDGETARFWAVEGAAATVIIVAESYPAADWDAFLGTATEIIESMQIDAET